MTITFYQRRTTMILRFKKNLFCALYSLLVVAILEGCTPFVSIHGNLPDNEMLESLKTNESTESDVLEIFGPPTNVSTFNTKRWYYVGERMERLAFFEPTITEKKVVALDFNTNGVLENVALIDTPHLLTMTPNPRKTKTMGKDPSLLQQLFGNFGKFSRQGDTEKK